MDLLGAAGAERIFLEKISTKAAKRPELVRLMEQLREGDVVIVTRFDRISRRLLDLIELVEQISAGGAGFRSLREDIDTTSSSGRLILHVMGAIAQFERDKIVERTREGLASARKRGRIGGRPPALTPEQAETCKKLLAEGESVAGIARQFRVSRSTIARLRRAEGV
ncbi:MAG: recombinase family protein [Paracoccus sp. (in: a-proteobacteria)]|nr:recombinase family protein [Paracoccus sp. (in: a-proteobacteria)]